MQQKLNELKARLLELGASYEDLHPFFLPESNYSLKIKNNALGVYHNHERSFVCVDFYSKTLNYRSQSHLFAELLVKAVLGRKKTPVSVLDATGGFGKDSYILALTGCKVSTYEAHPLMFTLLKDGWQRIEDTELSSRMQLIQGDSLQAIPSSTSEVIYLDPMYPETKKSAKNNKQMSFLQHFVGHQDSQAEDLLTVALNSNASKVVLKRPVKSAFCKDRKPTSQILGKAVRFDIYAL